MMTQRQCVLLKGNIDWCCSSAQLLLANFNKHNIIVLSEHVEANFAYKTITQKQAQKQLGKEFDAVVFDATAEFNADSFGVIVGTIKAGGALIVFLPNTLPDSLWLKRFSHIAYLFSTQQESIHQIEQGDELPRLTVPSPKLASADVLPTTDQALAINAILKVVHGHRRRPLVISSDRGRGKSAALGMAAAELLKQGKQSIIVTAPSLATVETLFNYARQLLPDATVAKMHIQLDTGYIRFIAPDALLDSDIKADLLLVDEAAAIPAAMLTQLLDQFSRIVFATTLHGYEGTGLGFAIRFKNTLDQVTPNWRSVKMTMPIRWADNDVLEAFSFKALLLDAEPVNEELVQGCLPTHCEFEQIDREAFVKDETSLRELFGLMVLAHYRTRPSDLQMMLGRDDISIYVLRYQGHIIASTWCVTEGLLSDELIEAVYAGQRRLKGHLLPQSLLAHAGVKSAGQFNYQRIIRIAVHPALHHQGIGTSFIELLTQKLAQTDCDVLGTSFAASNELISFWSQSQFSPVRLGIHHDEVSGGRALMMLKPVSIQGGQLVCEALARFQQQWPYLIQQQFSQLDARLIISIAQLFSETQTIHSKTDMDEVNAFALQQRGYEFSQIALWKFVAAQMTTAAFVNSLDQQQQALCVMSVLQQRTWPDIVQRLGLIGKKQAIESLRQAIKALLPKTLLAEK